MTSEGDHKASSSATTFAKLISFYYYDIKTELEAAAGSAGSAGVSEVDSVPFVKALRSLSCTWEGRDMWSLGRWPVPAVSALTLAESLQRGKEGLV